MHTQQTIYSKLKHTPKTNWGLSIVNKWKFINIQNV